MNNTTALQNAWHTILGFNLTTANKRWIADHLYQQIREEEELQPYTIEELQDRIAESEAQYEAGEYYTRDEVHRLMDKFVQEQSAL